MTLAFNAGKKELWDEIRRLRAAVPIPAPLDVSLEPCSAICSPQARKHLRYGAQGWTFLEGKKPLGVLGVRVEYCPFCGRKLQ